MTVEINVKNLTVEKLVEEFDVLNHEHVEVTFTEGTVLMIEPDVDGDFSTIRWINGEELKGNEAYIIESEDLYKRLELVKQHYGVHNSKQANPELWEEKEGVIFSIKGLVPYEWHIGEYHKVVEEWEETEEYKEWKENFERGQEEKDTDYREDFDDHWASDNITILPNFTEDDFDELYEGEDMYEDSKDRPYFLTMGFGDFPAIWVKG